MLDQLTEEKWPKTIKMILIFSTAILVLITLFFPNTFFYSNMVREVNWGEKMIGSEDFMQVMSDAKSNYKSFAVDTGVDSFLRDYYTLSPDDVGSQRGPLFMLANIFRNMAKNINYWIYMIIYRSTLILYWLPYMTIVLLPSVFAGTMRWCSKRYNFGYASPFLNRRSMVLIGWGIYSLLLSMFIPLPVPPMIGAVLMIALIPMGFVLLISNLPKRI